MQVNLYLTKIKFSNCNLKKKIFNSNFVLNMKS